MKIRISTVIGAALLGWFMLTGATLSLAFGSAVWWSGFIVFVACWLMVRNVTRSIAETQEGYLDEYERELKSRAISVGFWVALCMVSILMVFAAVLGHVSDVWAAELLQSIWQLILTVSLVSAASPTLWLGWRMRSSELDYHLTL